MQTLSIIDIEPSSLYIHQVIVLLGKLSISAFGICAYCFLCKDNVAWAVSHKSFTQVALLATLITRLFLFFGVVVLLSTSATSDVTVYYSEARAVLGGHLPLIDIKTAYGPLFPYLAAASTLVWNNAMVLIVVAICFEIITVWLWLIFSREHFSEQLTRRATLLYVFSPLALSNVPITGQNHIWLSAALAATAVLLGRKKYMLSGFTMGASIVCVKFLSLLFVPPLVSAVWSKSGPRAAVAWTTSFAILPVLVYGTLVWYSVDLGEQIRFHANYDASGNIPYLMTLLGDYFSTSEFRYIVNVSSFLMLCLAFSAIWLRGGTQSISRAIFACAFVLLIVLLLNKKSFSSYTLLCLFPLCLVVAQFRHSCFPGVLFGIWASIAAIEPTLWFRLMNQSDLTNVLASARFADVLFVFAEVLLVLGYSGLLILTWRTATSFEPGFFQKNPLRPAKAIR